MNSLSLRVESGVTLLFGSNGAGKSTLISLVEGLLTPTKGEISVIGRNPTQHAQWVMARIAFLPERPQYFGSNNVLDYLYWIISIGGAVKSDIERLLENFGIRYLLDQKFSQLSLGEMQLISLVAIMSLDRKYYVLDEPNANLDPLKRLALSYEISQMKREGKSFLISTHILDELISVVDHTIVISKGSVKMSVMNRTEGSGSEFSVYLSSTNRNRLLESLRSLEPRVSGDFVVVDGHSLGLILNTMGEVNRESLISAFSYPRLTLDE